MKKTWFKIKRGLLEPEHRERMGNRIWLFMYMIDHADWEDGIVHGWKDKEAAKDLVMPWRTLQTQRQDLESFGYIICNQKKGYQDIVIYNWIDPRKYSGEVLNPKNEDTQKSVPLNSNGTQNRVSKSANGSNKLGTPSFNSHKKNHINVELPKEEQILNSILDEWGLLFSDKPQPRRGGTDSYKKLIAQVKKLLKDERFEKYWQEALLRASESKTCQTQSWFDITFFLRPPTSQNPQASWEKCFNRWMSWQDEQISNAEAKKQRLSTKEQIERDTGLSHV